MRTLTKCLVAGACSFAIAAAAGAASAQPGMMAGPPEGRPGIERMAQFLDLSKDQVQKIEKLRDEHLSRVAGLRRELLRVRNEIRAELLEDSPDVSAIEKLVAKKADIRSRIELERVEHRLAVRKVLTPEQRDKMFMLRGRGAGPCVGRCWGGEAPGFGRRCGRGFGRGMGPRPDCPRMGL